MFKCPFCQSGNCEELRDYPPIRTEQFTYPHHSYNDDLQEMLCHDCGIVTKISPSHYNEKQERGCRNESK